MARIHYTSFKFIKPLTPVQVKQPTFNECMPEVKWAALICGIGSLLMETGVEAIEIIGGIACLFTGGYLMFSFPLTLISFLKYRTNVAFHNSHVRNMTPQQKAEYIDLQMRLQG